MSSTRIRPRRATGLSLAIAAAALLAGAVPVAPQSPALPAPARPPKTAAEARPPVATDKLPDARTIIDRHIAAIGGREAILSHGSTHATGTLSIPSAGMTGTIEIFAAKPNKSVLKITIEGVGEIQEGFNGTTGWNVSPVSGPMLLEGTQLEDKRFDADYYGELHDDSRYQSMTTVSQETFDGRPCYKIRLVRKNGGEDIEYYDVKTGLKAGSTTTRETQMGRVTGTTVETGYRRFGKLLLPASIRQSIMGLQQVITLSNIEYDTVPDSAFEPPAPIKALMK